MGVLSDAEMIQARNDGRLVIDPFVEGNVCTSSYDVRLGENFYREQHPDLGDNVFNIFDPAHVSKVWGKPQVAQEAADILWANMEGINPLDKVILLAPGETILAHTEEFIGARYSATTMMKARSTMGRNMITVCKCAGWGDIGYINRWTMEITNVSQKYQIPLVAGMRIAQIVFFDAGLLLGGSYVKHGSYQSTMDLETLKKEWRPEMMLPRTKR